MAKTYQTLISESRDLLQDSEVDQLRYTDAFLLNILNRSLQDLARIRPDIAYDLYATNSLNIPVIVEADPEAGEVVWTDPLGIEMQFYSTLISYVVAVTELADDEYSIDGRAALLLQMFRNSAIGI